MTEPRSAVALFEVVIATFRAHAAQAGDCLPLVVLLEAFHGLTAANDLEAALRFGMSERLIVRAAGKQYRIALTAEGAKRMMPRRMESGSES